MAKVNNSSRGPMGKSHGGQKVPEKAKNFKQSIKLLFAFLKPHFWQIMIALLFAVVGTVFSIIGPNITKKIGEEIFAGSFGNGINISKIVNIAIWLLLMYVTSFTFSFLQSFIMSGVTAKVTRNFRTQISKKINRLPLNYFDNTLNGDILSRITNDVDTVGASLNQSISQIVTSVTMLIGALIMMFINSWKLTLISLVATPVSMVLIMLIVKVSQKFFIKQQNSLGDLNGIVEENYSAHNIVKAYNGEKRALNDFSSVNNDLRKSGFLSQFISGAMYPIMNFINNIVYVIVIVVGGIMAIQNPLFAVTIVAFITYMRMFNQQIGQVAQISGTLQSTAAAAERVFEFLLEPELSAETKTVELPEKVVGKVEFKDVCFGYNKDAPIIKNFSAIAKPGQKIAIVGPTGAGKTTIVNLLMRFYEIDSGAILIDGINTSELTRQQCRSLFGMVLQDTWLFEGTIRENLAYGTNGLDDKDIENACCFAHVDHFIRSLPNGYDMMLDETANISQGQRQLLTIARAMVNNAPMLILDEATSSVDTRTEIMIQKAMDKLMEGRTSFVIAHRLSTIKNADLILVMKDGNIIESGNHDTLITLNGFYAELYNSQFANN